MRPEEADAVANALVAACRGDQEMAVRQLNDVIKSHVFSIENDALCLTITYLPLQYYRVIESGRIVRLIAHIEEERYLCVDDNDQSHPCYNLSDLKPISSSPPS